MQEGPSATSRGAQPSFPPSAQRSSLPQNESFILRGTEKGDFREELSELSNLLLYVLWLESFWDLFYGDDSSPLVLSQIPSWPNSC